MTKSKTIPSEAGDTSPTKSATSKRSALSARTYEEWLAIVIRLEQTGKLKTEVWPGGCGRCGGDMLVTPYTLPFSGGSIPSLSARQICVRCSVSQQKR